MPRISINGKRWSIKLASQEVMQKSYLDGHGKSAGFQLAGLCDYTNCQILVDQSLNADERKAALRHELIHLYMPTLTERQVLRLESLITLAGRIV